MGKRWVVPCVLAHAHPPSYARRTGLASSEIVVQSLPWVQKSIGRGANTVVPLRARREVTKVEENQKVNFPFGIWIAVIGIAAIMVVSFVIFLK